MSSSSATEKRQASTMQRLTLFYIATLVLIAGVVLVFGGLRIFAFQPLQANYADAGLLLGEEEIDALVVEQDASALPRVTQATALSVYLPDLKRVLAKWSSTHAELNNADLLDSQALAEVRARYEALGSQLQIVVSVATRLTDSYDALLVPPADLDDAVSAIETEAQAFVDGIDPLADQVNRAGDNLLALERTLDPILIGLALLGLAATGAFILRPSVRRVGASIAELERAEAQQRELSVLKDQFIVDANHELRTPIMALYNNLELLSMVERRGRDDPALRSDLIQQALRSGDGLLRLLNSVLDVGALDAQSPRLDPSRVELAPLVRLVLDTFDPRDIGEAEMEPSSFQSRDVSMDIPEGLVVWADDGRVRQVLINLISNALKYSPPGMPIAVSAAAWSEEPRRGRAQPVAARQQVRVSVRDQGLGVPPRLAPQLFQRFVRLPRDIAGPVRGNGVGLYLCRTLVEAMGGRIWVESSGIAGEGSTFSFTLPIPATPVTARHISLAPSRAGASALWRFPASIDPS